MTHTTSNVQTLRQRLDELAAERALAGLEGLGSNQPYLADLEGEIAFAQKAYVGAAVTQIATLRGELSGRLQG
ncbi:MAG TPA: hypothetical protein VF533_09600 [Solirubrobacteraceae bacterium]|jgi:hypothetical protein